MTEDEVEDVFAPKTAAKTEEDSLFCAALRFAPPELTDGIADPPLLPRDPSAALPADVTEEPRILRMSLTLAQHTRIARTRMASYVPLPFRK